MGLHHSPEHEMLIDGLGALCGIFVLDHDLNATWTNRWIAERFRDPSAVIDPLCRLMRKDLDFDHPGAPGPRRWTIPHPGTARADAWLEASVTIRRDGDGAVVSIIGKIDDVSARIRAETRLREEALRRKILVEQSSEAIVVLTDDGRVFEANQRFADMLGYSLEEAQELAVWEWDAHFGREEIVRMLGLANENGHHVKTQYRHKDGTLLDIDMGTNGAIFGDRKLIFCVCRLDTAPATLPEAVEAPEAEAPEILSMCAFCKKIRNDRGNWDHLEVYLAEYIHCNVSHGVCPPCATEHYHDVVFSLREESSS